MKNIKIKENKGITLISLVVTIILMIILAGISIVVLFGERGIITRAKEQKVIQTKAEILDQLELEKTSVLNYDASLYTDLSTYLDHINGKVLGAYKVTEIIEKEYENGVLVNAKIVVDGKYIYTAAQIENNVVINAEGYIEELDPQIDSFVVTNKTTNKIEVEAKVRRAEKYEFWILKNNEWVKDGTETTGNMDTNKQKEVTHEYEGLTSLEKGEKYQFKIVAIRGKREVEKVIDSEIKDVEIAEGNLIFDIQPTEWTNKEITTKIYKKTDEEGNILKELENLTIQYQINGTKETLTNNSKWIEYKEPIVTDKNIEIWVRLWDGINAGSATTRTITKIDKLAPTGSISVQTTTNSAKITVSAQDRNATTEDGKSGIKGYYYSKDGGKTYTNITAETSYTFTNLTQSTSLNIKVKVEDNAGNVTEITESGETSSTLKVANLTVTVADPNTWTNTTKTITITPSDNNYSKIRYTLDGSTPTTSSTEYTGAFTVSSNCTITAIALDSTNQVGSTATNSVTKIDKTPPGGTSITYNGGSNSCSWKNNYNLTLSSSDSQSGVSYYEIDTNGDGNADGTTGSNFIPGNGWSSCAARFRAVDNAGNRGAWTEGQHIHMDTQAPNTPSITYNGGSNSCSWKNNYNLTLSSGDNVGISYYEIDVNVDGNADGTTGSNFIPGNGWSSCAARFRAVDYAGNRSGWTDGQHIHMDTQAPGAPSIDITNASMSPSGWSFDIWTGGASDNIGIAYYQYTINDGASLSSSHIAGSGWFNYETGVKVRAVDHAGNVGPWSSGIYMNAKRLYIRQLYKAIRNAPGTESEVDYWDYNFAPATIAAAFFTSPEVEQNYLNSSLYNYIDRCYIGIFGRTSDSGGNSYYQSVFNSYGTRREAFANLLPELINSAESQNLYNNNGLGASTTNYDEVVALYNNKH